MKPSLVRAAEFNADFDKQYRWYLEQAGEEIAERFLAAVMGTLRRLSEQPELGRRRNFQHPNLVNLRSHRVGRPFDRVLVFYRVTDKALEVWRLMDGARDLPQRLAEPPR